MEKPVTVVRGFSQQVKRKVLLYRAMARAEDITAQDVHDHSRMLLYEVCQATPLKNTMSSAVEWIKACSSQDQSIHDQLHELIAKINENQKVTCPL